MACRKKARRIRKSRKNWIVLACEPLDGFQDALFSIDASLRTRLRPTLEHKRFLVCLYSLSNNKSSVWGMDTHKHQFDACSLFPNERYV